MDDSLILYFLRVLDTNIFQDIIDGKFYYTIHHHSGVVMTYKVQAPLFAQS